MSARIYVRKDLISDKPAIASVESNFPDSALVQVSEVELHPHPINDDRYLASFDVQGLKIKDAVVITAKFGQSCPHDHD